jgi:hypothetical protein
VGIKIHEYVLLVAGLHVVDEVPNGQLKKQETLEEMK